jgi:(hydroxyamino)benzene mutase
VDSQKCSTYILISGSAMILVGLVGGILVPMAPFPRLALGAHIQFVTNGMLFVIQALVLRSFRPRFGNAAAWIAVVAAFFTWLMALSEAMNSCWGTLQTLPIAGHEAGAQGGTALQEILVKIPHGLAAIALIMSWALLISGLFRRAEAK